MKKLAVVLFLSFVFLLGRDAVQAVVFPEVSVDTGNGYGSTGTFAERFATIDVNTGTAITYSQSAVNGDSFTINAAGVYAISYSDGSAGGDVIAISLNGSAASSLNSLGNANVLCRQSMPGNTAANCGVSVVLNSGDVIRAHRALATDGGTNLAARFVIAKVQ